MLRWANHKVYGWGANASGQLGNGAAYRCASLEPMAGSSVLAGKTILALVVGTTHSLALCADGTVAAWGENGAGQLGDGTTEDRYAPVDITRSGVLAGRKVVAIAAGSEHSLALCEDGTVAAWGQGSSGQLGNGQIYPSGTPVAVIRSGVLAGKKVMVICAGSLHSLALCADGTLVGWGNNGSSQLGDVGTSNRIAPVEIGFSGALAGKRVTAMSAGVGHSLVRFADGTLAAWGSGSDYRLGDGTTTSRSSPTAVPQTGVLAGKSVTKIATGATRNVVLCSDGTLVAWGGNGSGLGNGAYSAVPVLVSMSGVLAGKQVIDIAAGEQHGLALCSDGTLTAWGTDPGGGPDSWITPVVVPTTAFGSGQKITGLARGNSGHALVLAATPVSNDSALAGIAVGGGRLDAAFSPGTTAYGVWVSPNSTMVTVKPTAADPNATVNVNGTALAFGATSAEIQLTPGDLTVVIRVTAQDGQTATSYGLTLRDDSSLSSLALNVGTLVPAFSPTVRAYTAYVSNATPAVAVTAVATAARTTIEVAGELAAAGIPSDPVSLVPGSNAIPVRVTALDGNATTYTLSVVRQVAVNATLISASGFAITRAGFTAAGSPLNLTLNFAPLTGTTLRVVNNTGRDSINGEFVNLAQGQRVDLTYNGITYPYVANYYGGTGNDLVLHWANARVFGWGGNNYGQLGVGAASGGVLLPAPVVATGVLAGKTVIALACGNMHSLALCSDGTLASCGINSNGQLGNNSLTSAAVPVAVDRSGVLAGKTVIAIAAGVDFSVALCTDGTVVHWGRILARAESGGLVYYDARVPTAMPANTVLLGKTTIGIDAGRNSFLALCSDGTVAGRGRNDGWSLGRNSYSDAFLSDPAIVDPDGVLAGKTVTAIAAGGHGLALTEDGTLAAWGGNASGQLGNNTLVNSLVPVLVSPSGVLAGKTVAALAAGLSHSLVSCTDGTLAAWGDNAWGQLGTAGSAKVPVLVNRSGVLSGKTVTLIASGDYHCLAACGDGSLVTWGYNSAGQLGNNSTTTSTTPVLVGTSTLASGERFVTASGGDSFSMAITALPPVPTAETLAVSGLLDTGVTLNGRVSGQGSAASVVFEYGLTDVYGATLAATPATVSGSAATEVRATPGGLLSGTTYHYRVVATGAGGTVVGADQTFTTTTLADLTRLAVGGAELLPAFASTRLDYAVTVPYATTELRVTPASNDPAAVVTVNGTAVTSGEASGPVSLAVGNTAIAVGVSAGGGTNSRVYTVTVTRLPATFAFPTSTTVPVTVGTFIAAGDAPPIVLSHAPVPGANLTLVNNTGLETIAGTFANLAQGAVIDLTYNGEIYSFAVNYCGGTGNDLVLHWAAIRLMAWGGGNYGQLGNGGTVASWVPTPVEMSGALAGRTIIGMEVQGTQSVVWCADGTLATWGARFNTSGGTYSVIGNTPVAVDRSGVLAGRTAVRVAVGQAHCMALCSDGALVAWGNSLQGQLGNNDTSNTVNPPVLVDRSGVLAGKTVMHIAAGGEAGFALCTDGTLAGWGSNVYGRLGNGDSSGVAKVPALVKRVGALAGKTVVRFSAGTYHSLALCSDGTLAAWGHNNYGQLGNNTSTTNSVPVPVAVVQTGVLAGKTVTSIFAGYECSFCLCSDGTLAAWGNNGNGQLGNGTSTDSSVPVLVTRTGALAGKTITSFTGNPHCLALCSDGSVIGWGANSSGQLGNNSTTGSSLPTVVATGSLSAAERFVALDNGGELSVALVASPSLPVARSLAVTGLTDTAATLNGRVQSPGATSIVTFEYGPTSSYGTTVSATPGSVTGTAETAVSAAISGLIPGTVYHFRVVGSGGGYTTRGADLMFTTPSLATLAELSLSAGRLQPGFSAARSAYSVSVPFGTTSLAVTPVVTTPGATVTVAGAAVVSGAASGPLALSPGNNPIEIQVTSADGGTTLSYVLTVTRVPAVLAFGSAAEVPLTVGDLAVDGQSVEFALGFAPPVGTSLTVVRNTGLNPIQGEFTNLKQGQPVNLVHGGVSYGMVANYYGGSGNDLVLEWGNIRLLAWGGNGNGQLGNGSWGGSAVAVPVNRTGELAGRTVTSVAFGNYHCLALCAGGTVAVWGNNNAGQLGIGTTTNSNLPVPLDQDGVLAGKTVIAVAPGDTHSLALCSDGTVAAWGYNQAGRLGNNSSTDSSVPVPTDLTGVLAGKRVIALAGGGMHNLALCADGTLAAWGDGSNGSFGNGSTAWSSVPVLVDRGGVLKGKSVIAIAAGSFHSLALCSDGSLAAWGSNSSGQLGDGTTINRSTPVRVSQTGALAGKTVVAIAVGGSHNLALCSDGGLVAWGYNSSGQLGDNSTSNRTAPVAVTQTGVLAGKTVVSVRTGNAHSFALCADGTLASWGANGSGRLGDGTSPNRSTPVLVNLSGLGAGERVIGVAGGYEQSLVRVASLPLPLVTTLTVTDLADSSATLCGRVNANGSGTAAIGFEYGTSTAYGATMAAAPSSVDGTADAAVSAVVSGLTPGTLYHYRVVASGPGGVAKGGDLTFITPTRATLADLTNSSGALSPAFSPKVVGYTLTVPATVETIALTPVVARSGATVMIAGVPVVSGHSSAPLALIDGPNRIAVTVTPAGGGQGLSYTVTVIRLPTSFGFASSSDVPLTVEDFVAAGNSAAFSLDFAPLPGTRLTVVKDTGSMSIQGVFDNLAQDQVVTLMHAGIRYEFVADYHGGTGNDLVLHWAGTRLLAWGENSYGQLGNNRVTGSPVPVPVVMDGLLAGKTIKAVAAGTYHALALSTDGTLSAWGYNGNGRLGNPVAGASSKVPVPVDRSGVLAGKTVVRMAAGNSHSLALCTDGTLAAWGYNTSGQLGNGDTTDAPTPVRVDRSGVLAGKTITAIVADDDANLVLCADGTLAAWGTNAVGQLGNGSTVYSSVPTAVDQGGVLAGRKVVAIACGGSHTLALCADGTLAAWGYNSNGQLGNGGTTNSSVPVLVTRTGVLAGRTITAIACGNSFSLALCADGTLAAWGSNSYGELGNNSTTPSSVPVLVSQTGVLAGKTVVGIIGGRTNHCMAPCADGSLVAWGYNNAGQLGNGTLTNSPVPVAVGSGGLAVGERFAAASAGGFDLALTAIPPASIPTALAATAVTDGGATLNGSVNAQGGAANVGFEYGLTESYGFTAIATPASVNGGEVMPVSAVVSGLQANTIYHYRVVASNGGVTYRSGDRTFTTSALAALSNLTLSEGSLSPGFSSGLTHYLVSVPGINRAITVTPVVSSPAATVKVNGVAQNSGTPSGPISLRLGETPISVVVDAGDGVTTTTYTLKVASLPAIFTVDASGEVPLTVSDLAPGGHAVTLALNYAPVPGAALVLVNNTGPNPIQGEFSGLAEGQRVRLSFGGVTYTFVATYRGGTGNDLVLNWSNVRLVTWGSATNGGGSVNSNVPVPLSLTGGLAGKLVTHLAIGGSHGMLRCLDGTVAAWGANDYGQLGVGFAGNGSLPGAVDQTGVLAGKAVIAMATGGSHDLALCADGTLVAWGNNSYGGALGIGSSATRSYLPVQVDQSGVLAGKTPVAIGAGGNHSVALCADGSLASWGTGEALGNGGTIASNVPVRVVSTGVLAGKTPVTLAVGGTHSLVLCADGTLAAWGVGSSGQLGNGSTASAYVPVLVNRSGVLAGKSVTAIAAGGSHNLALCADGTLVAWGENGNGQLGNLSSTDSTVPVLVNALGPLSGRTVVAIAAGGVHSLALCSDGTLLAWGSNQYLTLGTGNSLDSSVPTVVAVGTIRDGERIVSISAGYYFSAALVASLPDALTNPLAATEVTDTGATLNGSVNPQTGEVGVAFEYGTSTAYGHTITASPAAVSGATATPVSARIGGLLAGVTYHYRVVATNGLSTARSGDMTFTTTAHGVLADLRLSGGALAPAFDPNLGDYLCVVPFAVESLRVNPVAATGMSSITVNGAAVASGATSEPIALLPGENTIRVSVAAADGSDGKAYTLSVTRLPGEFAFYYLTDVPLTVGGFAATGAAPPFSLHQPPPPGTVLTVVDNTGGLPIEGTFDNLAQGQLVPLTVGTTTWIFAADYAGGTGNDLVLHWAGNRVVGWGSNTAGQLGNGTSTDSLVPVPSDASGVLAGMTVVGVAAGGTAYSSSGHSLALGVDGRVAAWGANDRGQLGNGSTTLSKLPGWVNSAGVLAGKVVVAVAAGSGHSLALCSDGNVAAWGYNNNGQLGNGSLTDSSVPVAVGTARILAGRRVTAVAAGSYHNLALCSDGTLVSWGAGGALGNNSTAASYVPVAVDQTGVLAGKRVISIAAGQNFSLALCADGTLASWGNGSTIVLGNSNPSDGLVPVLVDRTGVLAGKTVVAIACGRLHAMVLCSDGTLAGWGANDRGQLGNNDTAVSLVPVRVDQTGLLEGKTITAISASAEGSMAMAADGSLATWGYNNYGQLGDNSKINRLVPTAVDSRALGSGGRYVMAVGGTSAAAHALGVVAMPLPTASPLAATGITGTDVTLNGRVNARENAATIAFEIGLDETYGTTVAASPDAVTGKKDTAVSAAITDLLPGTIYHYRVVAASYGGIIRGADRSFTTLSDNALLAELSHDGGVIAPGFEKQRFDYLASVPFETTAASVRAVTDHPGATVRVNGADGADGTVPISLAFGKNLISVVVTAEDGETTRTYTISLNRLPQEFVFNTPSDLPLTSDGFAAGGNPVKVVLGFAPTPGTVLTMVKNTGLGFICGRFGNLAQGQRVSLSFEGKAYDFIANYHGGSGNDLVLQWANTQLLAWGGNGSGQLGDTTTERRLVPTPVNTAGMLAERPVLSVAGGYLHSLALCSDGTLAAWGYNGYGQLGNDSQVASSVPVAVERTGALAGKSVVAISAGPFHNLALFEDGTIVAWGYNNHGQLGDGSRETRRVPVVVPRVGALASMQVVAVAAGAYQSFALGADGSVAAWGYNDEGELGDGSTTGSLIPVAVDRSGALAGKRVASLAAGQYHTLALCTDGTLASWGYNKSGQLGNDSTMAAASPVAIGGQGALAGRTPVVISAGGSHSLAWCADGTLAAWGTNKSGQLGRAGESTSRVPVTVDLGGLTGATGIAGLAVGGNHSLLRLADGRLIAWGENTSGQLGDGSLLSRAIPAEVTGLTGHVMAMANGVAAQHNLALQALPMPPVGALGATAVGLTGADLIAYAFPFDPARPGAARLPEARWVGGEVVIRFTQPATVTDILYGAEWSATLQPGSWQEVPDTGAGGEHRFAMPAGGKSQGFLRLKVTRR